MELYQGNKASDFRLLMDMLAEAQGLPLALRVLLLFEKSFAKHWRVQNITSSCSKDSSINIPVAIRRKKSKMSLLGSLEEANNQNNCEQEEGTLLIGWKL